MDTGKGALKGVRRVTYLALVIGIANLLAVSLVAVQLNQLNRAYQGGGVVGTTTSTTTYADITASGAALIPPTSFTDAPVITTPAPAGQRLTNINAPLNATELAVFNSASNAYFQTAGQMFLNKSLANLVGATVIKGPQQIMNGKTTVVYLGANTCIYCGENRWAMALALGRFGAFSHLFKGYSSLQDGDLPTVYWAPSRYNATSAIVFGNFYNSSELEFVSMEYQTPIALPVQIPSLAYLSEQSATTGNLGYTNAVDLIGKFNYYTGTPYTVWGKYIVPSADAIAFGNSSSTTSRFPLANLTHEQVLAHLAHPNDQFSWTQYAAADLYVAMVCATINDMAPICNLGAIHQIEAQLPQGSAPAAAVTAGGTSTTMATSTKKQP